jgi:hypothetical protein
MQAPDLIKLHNVAADFAATGERREVLKERLRKLPSSPLKDALAAALASHRPKSRAAVAMALADLPFIPEIAVTFCLHALERMEDKHRTDPPAELGAWGLGHLLDAAVETLIRAPEAAEPLIAPIERWIAYLATHRDCDIKGRVDTLRGRAQPTWGLSHHLNKGVPGGDWHCVAARPGRVVRPVLLYLLSGLRQPAPGALSDDGVIQMCDEALGVFREDIRWQGDRMNLDRPTKNEHEVMNHSLSWGRALLYLSELTGDSEDRRSVEGLAAFFKSNLIPEPGGLPSWAYHPSFDNVRHSFPSRIWKANHDITFAVDCHSLGVGFSEDDLRLYARVFKEVVLAPGYVNATTSSEVIEPLTYWEGDGNYGSALCGWNALGGIAPEIEPMIARTIAAQPSFASAFWFSSARSYAAYARRPDPETLEPAFPISPKLYALKRKFSTSPSLTR